MAKAKKRLDPQVEARVVELPGRLQSARDIDEHGRAPVAIGTGEQLAGGDA